jgi:hypothetical protein
LGRTDGIALVTLMERLFEFLTREMNHEPRGVAEALWRDYQRGGRRDQPVFLREFLPAGGLPSARARPAAPRRQARHLARSDRTSG